MKKASDLVAEAKAQIENLEVDQVDKERQEGALILDIRDAAELDENGRIPGSVHVPRGMLEFRADPTSPYHQEGLEPDRRIILHCASGGRSSLATATLKSMGYTNVAHLASGFKGWAEAGRPVEKTS